MYTITYRNTVRSGKGIDDFLEWLTMAWPIQKEWGADDVKYWQATEDDIVICQYHVNDLALWIKMTQSTQGFEISNALSGIIDMDKMSLKITRTDVVAA